MTPSFLTRLDSETRSYHAAADGPWLDLLAGTVTVEKYRDQLIRVYGFEGPLEAALAYTPHLPGMLDLKRRARSGWIAQDLLALGVKPAQLATVPQCMIAPFRGPAEALGWMYVHERSTHVHRSVKAQLLMWLPGVVDACAYLTSGGGYDAAWEQLGGLLGAIARTPQLEHQIISSAHDAFRCSREWFTGRELALAVRG